MADNKPKNNNILNSLGKAIRTSLDSLYTSTYYASPKNRRDLENIKNDISKSINAITTNNTNNTGIPNISSLYNRLIELTKDPKTSEEMKKLFDNEDLMAQLTDVVFQNQPLVELDAEIDTICKYMPKLLEALETRKDNVLSADHFSKDFLNIKEGNNEVDDATFYARVQELKNKYKLEEKVEGYYDDASRYGEKFVYCVPYYKAISKLLKNKANTTIAYVRQESMNIITESGGVEMEFEKPDFDFGNEVLPEIKLEINTSNTIESAIMETMTINDKIRLITEGSLYYSFTESLDDQLDPEKRTKKTFDQTIDAELDFNGFSDNTQDGLIDPTKRSNEEISENRLKNIRGAVLKELERSHVVPIYIEDMCMGYYYFEFRDKDPRDPVNNALTTTKNTSGSIPGLVNSTNTMLTEPQTVRQDELLKYVSGYISRYIDSKFVNTNQDLSKEIYMILKYNDIYNGSQAIKVSFIPPEDITHIYWKKDKRTHHGISDLEKAFIPAILYTSLYLTLAIAQMTRGQDKRVYYVKQQVETNISKTLLNTIEQIKKGNFGIRQVQSINTMLNMVGRFNDYVIPVSASGDAPVQFEVMQGQQIDTKPEILQELEESAINSTDVPIELIQARQSIDYAVQLTMTNSKFLRKVYNRQARYEEFLNPLITKLYNYEYNTNATLNITLQPPLFLNITNTNQIITNTSEFAEGIANIVLADEPNETVKVIANKKLKIYYMSSYFNMGVINRIIEESKQEATRIAIKSQNGEE